jgi:hypothetical protein
MATTSFDTRALNQARIGRLVRPGSSLLTLPLISVMLILVLGPRRVSGIEGRD